MLLAGDIGGTKTSLAIYSPQQGPREPLAEATFPSRQYPSLEAVIREFLGQVEYPIDRAVFGVAGPVVKGEAAITNLPWVIRESRLQEVLQTPTVRLLNDLEAIANAIPSLTAEDIHTLNHCQAQPGGSIAVIAPGTGLGEAYLTWDGSRYRAHPSEGGHTDFAPIDELQMGLWRYMTERQDHVSYEWVCSGKGIPNIYAYLKHIDYAPEPDWLAEALRGVADPTPIIVNAALAHEQQPCDLCLTTVNIFVSILGAEAGNLALKVLATGGVYLAGGIPPRILPALEDRRFMRAFLNKGRLSGLLIRMPVHVVLNPKAALLGAACYGLEVLEPAG